MTGSFAPEATITKQCEHRRSRVGLDCEGVLEERREASEKVARALADGGHVDEGRERWPGADQPLLDRRDRYPFFPGSERGMHVRR
jgi:hypothetical protein